MLSGKNTERCISIASKPSRFGVDFHNKGYELLGLNYDYIPLKVRPEQLEFIVQLVRDNFRGCSVSMPHKIEVMKYLDMFDASAMNIGAVNTIVKQENGSLKGYNTDYYGAKRAIETKMGSIYDKSIVMMGAGGVARAIGNAVKDLGGRLTISNRTYEKAKELAKKLNAKTIPYNRLENSEGYLVINATSIGMNEGDNMPFSEGLLSKFDAVMDVVVGETKLILKAQELEKIVISGRLMTVYQAAEQFRLYTRKELPEDFLQSYLS